MGLGVLARSMVTYLFILFAVSILLCILTVFYAGPRVRDMNTPIRIATSAEGRCVTFTLPPSPAVPNHQDPMITDDQKRQCYLMGGGTVILLVGMGVTDRIIGEAGEHALGHLRSSFGCWEDDQVSISTIASSTSVMMDTDDESSSTFSTRIEISAPEFAALQEVCEERFTGIPITICAKGISCPSSFSSKRTCTASGSSPGAVCASSSSLDDVGDDNSSNHHPQPTSDGVGVNVDAAHVHTTNDHLESFSQTYEKEEEAIAGKEVL